MAPKGQSDTSDVNVGYGTGTVSSYVVEFLTGGYSYSGAHNYGTEDGAPNIIPGFTANFNTAGYTYPDTDVGNSKFLNIAQTPKCDILLERKTQMQ